MKPDDGSQESASGDSAGARIPGSLINPITQPTQPLIVVSRPVVRHPQSTQLTVGFTEPNKIK